MARSQQRPSCLSWQSAALELRAPEFKVCKILAHLSRQVSKFDKFQGKQITYALITLHLFSLTPDGKVYYESWRRKGTIIKPNMKY